MEYIKNICDNLVDWLIEKVNEAGTDGLVFGLSGGVDSSVVAALSKKAFPNNSLGIIMPCHSSAIDEQHGNLIAKSIGLKTEFVDLTETYDQLIRSINANGICKLALANIKPRLRMTTLYCYAQSLNYLVVGPSNRSEFVIGYFTKHGDSGADLLPLASITKTYIWKMARYLKIPEIIIEKPPTAGLWENQTDEEELGFGYDILDDFIMNGTGPIDIIERINNMNRLSEHKRKFPQIFALK